MILAGGMSTRLYPLTKQVPKPLVPVAGIPNAVHLIRYLKTFGCDEIAINVHYLAGQIVEELGDGSQYGVKLTYLHEKVLLGSAGAVQQMQAFLTGDHFAVVGCDDLTDLPLDKLFAFHQVNGATATIGLVKRAEVDQYGVVVTDELGRITGFQEKPPKGTERSNLANTGIYVFSPEIFEHIPAGEFWDFGKNVFPSLQQADEAFFGFDAGNAYWCDIGTIPEYKRATMDVVEGRFVLPGEPAPHIDPAAIVCVGAKIEGRVNIGPGARIDDGAVIVGPCSIAGNVHVAGRARIERSILWQGARIGEGAALNDVIVGAHYEVPAGVSLEHEVVANQEPAVSR
ncbi:MAG: NDP-sugar synthase [Candidatus Eremiobacteraeota bacterium]|nr:NDP-sugar synthase [Candidatus Eremiobacteraeota bacterium]